MLDFGHLGSNKKLQKGKQILICGHVSLSLSVSIPICRVCQTRKSIKMFLKWDSTQNLKIHVMNYTIND